MATDKDQNAVIQDAREGLSIRHIRAFSLVADAGSITAAAGDLGRTQPAITQAINVLEHYFGAPLFVRKKTGMFLTNEGTILKFRAENALFHLAAGIRELPGLDKKERTRVIRVVSSTHLRALTAVADSGSFSEAAASQGMAVPTIHRSARDLERLVGTPLFERTSFGVSPTKGAGAFAKTAELAFSELDAARAEISAHNGVESGATAIGAMPLARSFLVPRALSVFSREFPEHVGSIIEGPYERLLHDLLRGKIHFMIGAARNGAAALGVTEEILFKDTLSILMRPCHPLLTARRLSAKRLLTYPWIAPRKTSPLRKNYEALLDGRVPADVVECNSLTASRVLLEDSDRLMLLSDAQARFELENGALVSMRPPGKPVARSIALTMRKGWHPTKAQQKLLQIIRLTASEVSI